MKAMVLPECCEIKVGDASPTRGDLPFKEEPLVPADLPVPVPKSGEILVKISACGVCHTELDEIEGRLTPTQFPVVPGHEIVGTVEALGPGVKAHKSGDRVGCLQNVCHLE